jgi:methylthioribulose-1-phosphate dehydratase
MEQSVKTLQHITSALVDAGMTLYTRGWVPATSGNFSARYNHDKIAITVSGRDKGSLTPDDIMIIDSHGRAADNRKPSAEALLHTMIYKHFPDMNAVLHTHSINATLISRLTNNELKLSGYEILKAFDRISTHETSICIPIFLNDQDIARLSHKVVMYLENNPPIFGFLITGHGLYTWGRSIQETLRHLEAFEFLFECELKLMGVR